jgi:hypothetical protein
MLRRAHLLWTHDCVFDITVGVVRDGFASEPRTLRGDPFREMLTCTCTSGRTLANLCQHKLAVLLRRVVDVEAWGDLDQSTRRTNVTAFSSALTPYKQFPPYNESVEAKDILLAGRRTHFGKKTDQPFNDNEMSIQAAGPNAAEPSGKQKKVRISTKRCKGILKDKQCPQVVRSDWRCCPMCNLEFVPEVKCQCGQVLQPEWNGCPRCPKDPDVLVSSIAMSASGDAVAPVPRRVQGPVPRRVQGQKRKTPAPHPSPFTISAVKKVGPRPVCVGCHTSLLYARSVTLRVQQSKRVPIMSKGKRMFVLQTDSYCLECAVKIDEVDQTNTTIGNLLTCNTDMASEAVTDRAAEFLASLPAGAHKPKKKKKKKK